jgi:hypothetical protein
MANTVDPVTTTTIDHIMAELELLNRRMDHREDLLLSITVKLGLLSLTTMKMHSSSPSLVPPLVLRLVKVAASLVVETLPLASPMPELFSPPSGSEHHRTELHHLMARSWHLLCAPRPAPWLPRLDLICLKEHESALPLVTTLHDKLRSSPQQEQVIVELLAPHVNAAIIVSMVPPSLICTIIIPITSPIITLEQISFQPAFLFKMVAPSILELKDRVSSVDWPCFHVRPLHMGSRRQSNHCAGWLTSSWICSGALMDFRNKYNLRCKRHIF